MDVAELRCLLQLADRPGPGLEIDRQYRKGRIGLMV
jgi:hypothetical protein